MAMTASDIEQMIKEALPDAQVTIEDLRGDGDHYAALVVSEGFRGKSRVQALSVMGVKFKGIDVLTDPGLREGIKQFANWPTIPQLYVKGEFIGGCDIVREMYGSGELQALFKEKGIAFADAPAA